MTQRYLPGACAWTKIRRCDTTEAITGTLTRPQLLILGRHAQAGRLHTVGRTISLRPDAGSSVAGYRPSPTADTPWARVRFVSACCSRDTLDTTLLRPELVAEISAATTAP
ncbi:hypothetical protein ACFXPT_05670 [Streptomyces goshikiensis]|uniref:hypothetical protein n=1 Tax=Streptomyces goshikiensis TaxID=1942 RepID=UPI0036A4A802